MHNRCRHELTFALSDHVIRHSREGLMEVADHVGGTTVDGLRGLGGVVPRVGVHGKNTLQLFMRTTRIFAAYS